MSYLWTLDDSLVLTFGVRLSLDAAITRLEKSKNSKKEKEKKEAEEEHEKSKLR